MVKGQGKASSQSCQSQDMQCQPISTVFITLIQERTDAARTIIACVLNIRAHI